MSCTFLLCPPRQVPGPLTEEIELKQAEKKKAQKAAKKQREKEQKEEKRKLELEEEEKKRFASLTDREKVRCRRARYVRPLRKQEVS